MRTATARSRSASGASSAGSSPNAESPPVLGATLGGASDGADHWAHTLLNHPDDPHIAAAELGHGPRYFRLQVTLTESVPLDDASEQTLNETLPAFASN